jgi:polysaccharide export outer membrane protein
MDLLRIWRRVLVVALLSAVCACGTEGAPSPTPTAANSQAAEAAQQAYTLGPGDRLHINVYGEATLTGEYVVSPSGDIAFPLIGDYSARGKTISEFTDGLRTALMRYVLHPDISVEVMNYRPFYILGEVTRAGTYPYAVGLNVMNAVATAGGFSYRADTHRVFIKHADEVAERQYRLTSTTPVLPGDTVRIPERRF